MADRSRHPPYQSSDLLASNTDLPKEVLIARGDVLWEVLSLQLKPSDFETDELLAALPPTSPSIPSSALDQVLHWTRPAPEDASVVVLQTLRDLGLLSILQIDIRELAKLILSIRKLYRLPDECPYHNWSHASAVAYHACVLAYRLELIRKFASPLPVFALIIAALCHDMDHRGTSNGFNSKERTTLWHAYAYSCIHTTNKRHENGQQPMKNNGSLLETHHFNLFHGLFKTCYPRLLQRLSGNEIATFHRLVEVIILATDLAAHSRVVQAVKQIKISDLTSSAPFPLEPVLSLFIGACDLSASARDWLSSMKAARGIYLERAKESSLSSGGSSQSTISNLSQDQCVFVETFVRPIFVEIARLFPTSHPGLTAVDANLSRWRKLVQSSLSSTQQLENLIEAAERELSNDQDVSQRNKIQGDGFSAVSNATKNKKEYSSLTIVNASTRKSPRSTRRTAVVPATTRSKLSKQSVNH